MLYIVQPTWKGYIFCLRLFLYFLIFFLILEQLFQDPLDQFFSPNDRYLRECELSRPW